MTKLNQYGMLIIILLIAIIAIGGIVAWSKYSPDQPIEISTPDPSSQQQLSQIYIGGAVTNPGFYPLKASDTTETLIQAAGGIASSADLSQLKLYIPEIGEELHPQKININLAEAWLIEALPGIGETRAQAIVNYRSQNGQFQNINELIKVEGIGTTTYEKIKHLITVVD
jgi:competence protein ComEA